MGSGAADGAVEVLLLQTEISDVARRDQAEVN